MSLEQLQESDPLDSAFAFSPQQQAEDYGKQLHNQKKLHPLHRDKHVIFNQHNHTVSNTSIFGDAKQLKGVEI